MNRQSRLKLHIPEGDEQTKSAKVTYTGGR